MKLFRPEATIYYRDGALMDKKRIAEKILKAHTLKEAIEEVYDEYSCVEDVQFFIIDEDLDLDERIPVVIAEGRIIAGELEETKLV